ncbi:MAG TPA: type II secretion system secretin GspD [Steroidobacteraceae bacterium]|nr:type II secretion system secretin GspD [Steroidobacteraceae bacterium]
MSAAVSVAAAQAPGTAPGGGAEESASSSERITPNFKDADIGQVAEAVHMATHRTFIIDPRVRAQVTMLSSTPMTPAVFYQAFLAILQVHGFVAVDSGGIVKIMPDANARFMPGIDLPDHVSATSDELVTQVIQVRNISAAQLMPVLRPLVPNQAMITAYPAGNVLIVSDRASNVNRLMRIIARIDEVSSSDVEVMTMQNASATEVARIVSSLYQGQGPAEGGTPIKLVADERSNSILISGDANQRLRAKALIAHLDTPLQQGGDTRVRYLRYADAEKLAPKLKEQMTGLAAAAGAPGQGGAAAAQSEKNTGIWADANNNALIITAPPKLMRQINAIIDQLDIRRAQVLVEAIIVDVDLDNEAELGVNWAVWGENNGTTIPGATFLTPVGGASLIDLASAIQNPSNINPSLESGGTFALGRVAKNGLDFAAMLRALRSDDNTNIIATPSAVTMDHQEATIKIAQEVPFITGQYTNASTVAAGTVTPFQTVQREEVGTILKLTPQINEGDAVVMKIELESSSVVPKNEGPQGAVDLTTNKRTVSTNVLIEDGGIIVLGGLISDEFDFTQNGIPLLQSIPLIGALFRDRQVTHKKSDLMIFIRPKILIDGTDTSIATNQKYNFIRNEERAVGTGDSKILPLLPGVKAPELPSIPPPPAKGTTPVAPVTLSEKERAAQEEAQRQREARHEATGAGATTSPAPPATPSTPAPSPQLQPQSGQPAQSNVPQTTQITLPGKQGAKSRTTWSVQTSVGDQSAATYAAPHSQASAAGSQ